MVYITVCYENLGSQPSLVPGVVFISLGIWFVYYLKVTVVQKQLKNLKLQPKAGKVQPNAEKVQPNAGKVQPNAGKVQPDAEK